MSLEPFSTFAMIFLSFSQTLLETTTNLLNSDLHWSLSHLRKAVSRGLHPRQDHCNICLQQYKRRQESEEEIIIFRYTQKDSIICTLPEHSPMPFAITNKTDEFHIIFCHFEYTHVVNKTCFKCRNCKIHLLL